MTEQYLEAPRARPVTLSPLMRIPAALHLREDSNGTFAKVSGGVIESAKSAECRVGLIPAGRRGG